jgi:hypothetical protein
VDELINKLELIHGRLRVNLPKQLRPVFETLDVSPRGLLILGPRGVGKTTLALIKAHPEMLYIPADHPLVASHPLVDIGEAAFSRGYRGIIVDEVHCSKAWASNLKALYDAWPRHFIWATDSSSVCLEQGLADLSRRFVRTFVPLLSFREYLSLKTGVTFPVLDPFHLRDSAIGDILAEVNVLALFSEYLQEGLRPFFLEGRYADRMRNVIDKMIYQDVPYWTPQLRGAHFRLMRAICGHIALSPIPRLNIESFAREWETGKPKLYDLLEVMERICLLRIVRRGKGMKKIYHHKAKVFLYDPSMYHVLDGDIANVREAFVACALQEAGLEVATSPDEEKGDFVTEGFTLEVGGPNKKKKNADYVVRDGIDVPVPGVIPMWILGMMW